MKTFAERAKAIERRYPNAKYSTRDKEAMTDELQALANEQEAYKQENQIPTGGNEFALGGPPPELLKDQDITRRNLGSTSLTTPQVQYLESMIGEGVAPDPYTDILDTDYDPTIDTGIGDLDLPDKTLKDRFRGTLYDVTRTAPQAVGKAVTTAAKGAWEGVKTGAEFLDDTMEDMSPTQANSLAGMTSIMTNLINKGRVKDATRVEPKRFVPSIESTYFDNTAVMDRLERQSASARYALGEKAGNLDDYVGALMQIQQGTGEALVGMDAEAQKLNMGYTQQRDAMVNTAIKSNVDNYNQSLIDVQDRQDVIDGIRRDYTDAAGASASNMFKDIADQKIGDKAGELYELLGYLNSNKNG